MTFCSKEQNDSEIIVSIEQEGYSYFVEYLDGRASSYYHPEKNHYQKLVNTMLEQAKLRDKLDYKVTFVERCLSSLALISVISLSIKSFQEDFLLLGCICVFLSLYLSYRRTINVAKLRELKKYRIFLENYEEIKKHPEVNKAIEIESLYRIPIDIFHIDELSLMDMREIKKQLKKYKK